MMVTVTQRVWCIKDNIYKTMQFEVDFDLAKMPATAFYKAIRNKNGRTIIGNGVVTVTRVPEKAPQ